MRVCLLDSHVLLWWLDDSPKLGPRCREIIANDANEVFVSVASLWELAIKCEAGKLKITGQLLDIVRQNGFEILTIEAEHAVAASRLPPIHKDPFDRMLVAQAKENEMTLVSADKMIGQYEIALFDANQ